MWGQHVSRIYLRHGGRSHKRINSGLVVVVIATISAFIAGAAWAIPLGPIGWLVGIPWFAVMLLLERSILQQMDAVAASNLAQNWLKGNFETTETKAAISIGWLAIRFTMILFICYFNSEMIRVIMFKPEIVAEIKLRQDAQTAHIVDSMSVIKKQAQTDLKNAQVNLAGAQDNLNTLIMNYDEQIRSITDSINMLNAKLPYEVKGPGGISGNAGDGPVANSIRESIRAFESQKAQLLADRANATNGSAQATSLTFNKAQLDSAQKRATAELATIEKKEKELVEKIMARPVNGLAFMLEVLNDIAGRNLIIWAVFFLFFFIEGIPVLLKFFSKNDSFVHHRAIEYLELHKGSQERARAVIAAMKEAQKQFAALSLQN